MMIEQILDEEQEPLVNIRNMSVSFDSQDVLRDINLRIPAGETLVLLGESGCGKSLTSLAIMGPQDLFC